MKYRNFLKGIFLGFLIGCFVFALAFIYQLGVPTQSNFERSELYEFKTRLAKSTNSPKLAIIAGSSARLGISCKLIKERIGISCFNGGTVADMSVDYVLSLSRKWLNPRDTVLLPLEYYYYNTDDKPNVKVIDYVISHDIEYLLSLDLKTKVQFLSSISLQRLKEGILAKLNPPQYVNKTDLQETHNQYGDSIDNREADMTKELLKNQETIAPLGGVEYWDSINLNNQGIKSIAEFIDWCNQNNIKLLATWPNTTYFDIYKQEKQQSFLKSITNFYETNNVPVIGKPEDFMYDKSMFYDSNYHLHDRGVKIRTLQLIELIKPYLK
ncbi:MAG: hypothetical protein VKN72_25290 [Nostocales cyanobacterium 94392]|nr:hypothetical protein [Nostocales cyanobacterium 94392]